MNRIHLGVLALALAVAAPEPAAARGPLVLLTDFGTRDGAVSAMKGVAYGVSPALVVSDLTHQAEGIWSGGYRLRQAAPYWPKGSVFVAVVDPGVGTDRRAVVLRTKADHTFVGPDNGLFTFIAEEEGIAEVRVIDERTNRRPGSAASHTFHGRDLFAYAGARLAAGKIGFAAVGPKVDPSSLVLLPHEQAGPIPGGVAGNVPVLDVEYGNVWTNVPIAALERLGVKLGDRLRVRFLKGGAQVAEVVAPYRRTFGEVPPGEPLVYANSLLDVAVALNLASFAEKHGIGSGPEWRVELRREP